MNKAIASVLGAMLLTGTAGSVLAADRVYVQDDGYAVRDRERTRVIVPDEGPRVYGWTSERPLDCGAFHYWNGVECLDARDTPPDVGPKP